MKPRDPSIRLAADWDGQPRLDGLVSRMVAVPGAVHVAQPFGGAGPFVVSWRGGTVETWEPEIVLEHAAASPDGPDCYECGRLLSECECEGGAA